MPRKATGNVYESKGRLYARVTLGPNLLASGELATEVDSAGQPLVRSSSGRASPRAPAAFQRRWSGAPVTGGVPGARTGSASSRGEVEAWSAR
jgi:hypothetical protein